MILPKEIICKILLYNIHPIAEILNNIYINEYGTKYLDYDIELEITYPSYFIYCINKRP